MRRRRDALRGRRETVRAFRVWRRRVCVAVLLAALSAVTVSTAHVWWATTAYERYLVRIATVARWKLKLGFDVTETRAMREPDGTVREASIADIVLWSDAWEARYRVREVMASSVWPGVALGVVTVMAVLGRFAQRDRRAALARKVRGGETLTARELTACVQPVQARVSQFIFSNTRQPGDRIGGIPYPDGAQTRHTLVCGDPCAGRTAVVAGLLEQVRDRGERAAIYDPGGMYLRRFFDPGRDVILNPLDARSRRWSVVAEAQCAADYDRMAAAAIPETDDGQNPCRVIAARQLFRDAAEALSRRDCRNNRILAEHLMGPYRPSVLKGYTNAVSRALPNIYGVEPPAEAVDLLADRLSILRYVRADGPPFSIRDWMGGDESGGFLFITSEPHHREWLRGLMSLWVETAVNGLLARPAHSERRAWAILNDVASLNRIPSLEAALADSGELGGCVVLGVSSINALRTVYGDTGAEQLAALCVASVVVGSADQGTAEWCAQRLCDGFEPKPTDSTLAYGVAGDGGNASGERIRTVASKIRQLPDDNVFLRFRGPFPAARTHVNVARRCTAAKRFEPIEHLGIIERALRAARGRPTRGATRGALTQAAPAEAAPARVAPARAAPGNEGEAANIPEAPDSRDGYGPDGARRSEKSSGKTGARSTARRARRKRDYGRWI